MQIDPPAVQENIGGKAYQLCRLAKEWRVPRFFVLTFANALEIAAPEVQARIIGECRQRGYTRMAVRSSASLEDGDYASFAGVFESVLGVSEGNIIDAVRRVLASTGDSRVAAYCEARGIRGDGLRMAVVVQELINSRVSGVCLTRVSDRDRNDCTVIEACYGLGEALVSGRVAPDTYVLDRQTGATIRQAIGYQKEALWIRDGASARYEELPFHKRKVRKLTAAELEEISNVSLAVENSFSFDSADIEWAYDQDLLYLLQARRLVKLDRDAAVAGTNVTLEDTNGGHCQA